MLISCVTREWRGRFVGETRCFWLARHSEGSNTLCDGSSKAIVVRRFANFYDDELGGRQAKAVLRKCGNFWKRLKIIPEKTNKG